MKKMILFLLLMVCAISAAAAPNPWVEATPEQILQETGLSIACPASAQDVIYRLLPDQSLAEMQFAWCGGEYVLRICPTAAFEIEDISGMYFDWTEETPGSVRGRDALVRRTMDGDQHVESCLWIDIAPGLMYSLSAVSPVETDIRATAEMLFVPVQGETDAIGSVTAMEIADVLLNCTGYEGTAGASLKEAIAACETVQFVLERNMAGQDPASFAQEADIAWMAMPEIYRAEAKFGFDSVAALIDGALVDPEGAIGLFEDAGVADTLPALLQEPSFLEGWQAFYWGLQNETDM